MSLFAIKKKRKGQVEMSNEEVAVTLAEHGKEIGSLKHRMDDMETLAESIKELAISVNGLSVNVSLSCDRMERYEDSLRLQGERIGELEKKPAKRWDLVITTIITAIASGAVTYIFSGMF